MPTTIEQGDIFGRIGKAFGEGASTGASEQFGRNRLSGAIEDIQTKNLTPSQQLGELYRKGANAEQVNQILPFLRERGIINEAGQNQGILPSSGANVSASQGDKGNISQAKSETPTRLIETPEAKREGGFRYTQISPLRFRTIEQGEEQYQKDVDKQKQLIGDVNKRFVDVGGQLLQKGRPETYSDVLGELQKNFEKKAEDAVLSGKMSVTDAGDKYTKEMLDFAKARDKLTTQGPDRWRALLTGNPQKELLAARKAYENAEAPEAFKNDLIAHRKLSEPRASELAFPLSKDNERFFKDLKMSKGLLGNQDKVFQDALDRLSKTDSIQNFALQLSKKGYSPSGFMDYAKSHKNDLEPIQQRELQNIPSFNPTLSDMLYYTLIGKGG